MKAMRSILTAGMMSAVLFGAVIHAQGYAPILRGAAKMIDEAIEVAMKVSGRTLGPAARRAATQQLRQVVLKHGDEALNVARNGGLELLEAAGKYGDDVWTYARHVPEGARALALRADELVPAVRRIGIDVLKVEAKNPGLSSQVVRQFGDDAVRYFSRKVTAQDATRLVGYAKRADTSVTRRALLEAYQKKGTAFLERLEWRQIMAYGLSISMVTAAYQVSDGIQDGLETVSKESPETFFKFGREFSRPFTLPALIFGIGVAVILLVRFQRNNRWLNKTKIRSKALKRSQILRGRENDESHP